MATPRDLDPKFKNAKIPTDAKPEIANDTEDPTVDKRDSPITGHLSPEHANIAEETAQVTDEPVRREGTMRITPQGHVDTEVPADADNDVSMIKYTERFMGADGFPHEKIHGPMPVTEWPAYAIENGL